VAYIMQHCQLELSLHLRDCQLFIKPLFFSCDQNLRNSDVQETLRQTLEPSKPILFSISQIDFPDVTLFAIMLFLSQLRRNWNPGWIEFFKLICIGTTIW
jgi:hypothetical protein